MFQSESRLLPSGLFQDEFERTSVNMSTYLVAFVVANFSAVSKNVSETLVGLGATLAVGLDCTFLCASYLHQGSSTHIPVLYTFAESVLVSGVCVLCAREDRAHQVCSGSSLQTAGVLQHFL